MNIWPRHTSWSAVSLTNRSERQTEKRARKTILSTSFCCPTRLAGVEQGFVTRAKDHATVRPHPACRGGARVRVADGRTLAPPRQAGWGPRIERQPGLVTNPG